MTQTDTTTDRPLGQPKLPSHAQLSRLVARSLGLDAGVLTAGLQRATLAELPAIVAFRRQHLATPPAWDDEAYLRWRYRLGRDGEGFGDLWCLSGNGQLIAMVGVEDLRAELDGQRLEGAQVMDLLARSDVQDSGVGIWLNQAMLARYAFVLAVGANQHSAGIVRRMFEPLPSRLYFTHPLDIRPFLERRWPAIAATPLAVRAGNGGLALWRFGLGCRQPRGLSITRAQQLTPGIGMPALLSPAHVRLIRDSSYIQKRWLDNPRRAVDVYLAHRGPVLAGCMAWTLDHDENGGSELRVRDWHYDREDAFAALLHAAIREALAQGCTCVRLVIQNASSQRTAARMGFMRSHQDPGRLSGVQSSDPDLADRLAHATWRLTCASDDTDGL